MHIVRGRVVLMLLINVSTGSCFNTNTKISYIHVTTKYIMMSCTISCWLLQILVFSRTVAN